MDRGQQEYVVLRPQLRKRGQRESSRRLHSDRRLVGAGIVNRGGHFHIEPHVVLGALPRIGGAKRGCIQLGFADDICHLHDLIQAGMANQIAHLDALGLEFRRFILQTGGGAIGAGACARDPVEAGPIGRAEPSCRHQAGSTQFGLADPLQHLHDLVRQCVLDQVSDLDALRNELGIWVVQPRAGAVAPVGGAGDISGVLGEPQYNLLFVSRIGRPVDQLAGKVAVHDECIGGCGDRVIRLTEARLDERIAERDDVESDCWIDAQQRTGHGGEVGGPGGDADVEIEAAKVGAGARGGVGSQIGRRQQTVVAQDPLQAAFNAVDQFVERDDLVGARRARAGVETERQIGADARVARKIDADKPKRRVQVDARLKDSRAALLPDTPGVAHQHDRRLVGDALDRVIAGGQSAYALDGDLEVASRDFLRIELAEVRTAGPDRDRGLSGHAGASFRRDFHVSQQDSRRQFQAGVDHVAEIRIALDEDSIQQRGASNHRSIDATIRLVVRIDRVDVCGDNAQLHGRNGPVDHVDFELAGAARRNMGDPRSACGAHSSGVALQLNRRVADFLDLIEPGVEACAVLDQQHRFAVGHRRLVSGNVDRAEVAHGAADRRHAVGVGVDPDVTERRGVGPCQVDQQQPGVLFVDGRRGFVDRKAHIQLARRQVVASDRARAASRKHNLLHDVADVVGPVEAYSVR